MSSKVKKKFDAIENEMRDFFLERDSVIRGLIVALLSEQNIVFIGPPGTGKSMMVRNLASRIVADSDEDYFEWLMTKYTKPEEILGPPNIKKLIDAVVEFNPDYKLPRAKIAYLDEIFKCNSSLLNCLLSAINEKIVYNGNKPMNIPLQMLVGTSNEIPTDESLKALYDRFRIRFETEYLKEPSNILKLISKDSRNIPCEAKITMEELDEARAQIGSCVTFPEEKQKLLGRIILSLNEAGLRPSDRTINHVSDILTAEAWMNNRVEVEEYDMEILEHMFWDDPAKRKEVRSIIFKIINPLGEKVMETYERCHQAYLKFVKDIKSAKKEEKRKIIAETLNSMQTLYKDMRKDIGAMENENRPTARYESMAESLMLLITDIKTDYV